MQSAVKVWVIRVWARKWAKVHVDKYLIYFLLSKRKTRHVRNHRAGFSLPVAR
jgi:hypothetical protein